jgi:glycerophosphoryl diester phosphodiesterase
MSRPLVIAHRTYMLDAPENSLAGIALAAEAGADGVELDVRRSRDGVAVLFHDRLAWRLSRRPWPVALLRASGMVTLAEALAACPATLRPALDVKSPSATPLVIEAIRASGRIDALFWCRRADAIGTMRAALPEVETALLRNTRGEADTVRYLADAAAAGADAVSIHERAVSPAVVAEAERVGVRPYAWVVTEDAHRRVLEAGVAGVTTDWPRTALRLLREPD